MTRATLALLLLAPFAAAADPVAVILFTQEDCGPCRAFKPQWDEYAAKFTKPGVVFREVNLTERKGEEYKAAAKMAADLNVGSTPTVVVGVAKGNGLDPLIRFGDRPQETDLKRIIDTPTHDVALLIEAKLKGERSAKTDTGTCAAPKCPAQKCLTGAGLKALCDEVAAFAETFEPDRDRPVARPGEPAVTIASGTLPSGQTYEVKEYATERGNFGRYVQAGQSVRWLAFPETGYECQGGRSSLK